MRATIVVVQSEKDAAEHAAVSPDDLDGSIYVDDAVEDYVIMLRLTLRLHHGRVAQHVHKALEYGHRRVICQKVGSYTLWGFRALEMAIS